MRSYLIRALGASLACIALPALAQTPAAPAKDKPAAPALSQPVDASKPAAATAPAAAAPAASQMWIAPGAENNTVNYKTVIEPGATIAPGQFWRTIGAFGPWTSNCEILFVPGAPKKQACLAQQITKSDVGALRFDIAQTPAGENRIYVYVPSDAARDKGVTLNLKDGANVVIPFEYCLPAYCRASKPLDEMLKTALFLTGPSTIITFTRASDGKPFGAALLLTQLREALAATQDPAARIGLQAPAAKAAAKTTPAPKK